MKLGSLLQPAMKVKADQVYVAHNFVTGERKVIPWTRVTRCLLTHPVTGKKERCIRYELYPLTEKHQVMEYDLGRRHVLDICVEPGSNWDSHAVIADLPTW